MKKLLILILVLILALSFGACNLLPIGGGTATTEEDDIEAQAGEFLSLIASKTYHIKYKSIMSGPRVEELDEVIIETEKEEYAKDGMTAIVLIDEKETVRTVVRDGKVYHIVDKIETMVVREFSTDEEATSLLAGIGRMAGTAPSGFGTDEFNGETLNYAEYNDEKGTVRLFMRDSTLVGIHMIGEDYVLDIIILVLDQNIPDDIFDIPEGYTQIGE